MTDYTKLTVKQLQSLCKHKEKFRWSMRKDKMIELLSTECRTNEMVGSVEPIKITPDATVTPPLPTKELGWIPWSEKSKDAPFKSSIVGVGDGEEKVSREFDTPILGQNSSYDMMVILNGVETKCDVKKLDAQDDFNTGKEGRDALRPLKTLHAVLLDSLNVFAKSSLFTPEEKESFSWFHDVSPDELAVGTLRKLKDVCMILCLKKKALRSTLPLVGITAYAQTKEMPLDLFYSICQKLDWVFPPEFSSYMETIQILQKMDHIYIDEPEKLMDDLHSLVGKIFTSIKLILVHQEKGYLVLEDTTRIQFYRITRGHPRFKVLF